MKRIPLLLALMACPLPLTAVAQAGAAPACGASTVTVETTACVQRELDAVDHVLNLTYDIALQELTAGSIEPNTLFYDETKRTLVESERQWVKYRDAQCAVESAMVAPGTAAPVVTGQCLTRLTRERLHFLRHIADDVHWKSKLCRSEQSNCVLPAEPP